MHANLLQERLKKYGTMTIKPISSLHPGTQRRYRMLIKTNSDIAGMIKRLIPDHASYPFAVSTNPENLRSLRMVMREYPLEISKQGIWNELQMNLDMQTDLESLISDPSPVTPSPRRFTGILLPFQKIGLDFLLKTNGIALLADEMGLGKTVQTLAFVAQRPECMPVVIIAPLVTLQNWKREIERFVRVDDESKKDETRMPRVQIVRTGSRSSRLAPADFYLINYELIHKRARDFAGLNPRLVVFDEIQNLRNTDTRKFGACKMLARHGSVRHRIGLSGTPIYNKGIEVYGMSDIIRPGLFGERDWFVKRFGDNPETQADLKASRESLSRFLQSTIMIRRKKKEVIADLPDKNRLQQEVPIDSTMYKTRIKRLYNKIERARKKMKSYKTAEAKKKGLLELNKTILEMRVEERQVAGLAKAPYIVEYIAKLLEDYEDEKFVIFCHHRSVHKIIHDGLWQFNPLQIIGGQTDSKRQESIDLFQEDQDHRVIICGLRAGNVGINLTSASYVIFAEMDWSPAIHRQAEDRLHRIGQKNSVFSHYLVGLGTFDEYLGDLLIHKSEEINEVMGDSAEMTNNKKALELLEARFGPNAGAITDDMPKKSDTIIPSARSVA